MKRIEFVNLIFILLSSIVFSQDLVDVANLNVKLSLDQTADHYYTFDKGDEIVVNFNMIKGKHMKMLEITALPSNVKFTEFKARSFQNRIIKVHKKGVYRFRVYSSSITNRVCKLQIQRKPSGLNTINFNTDWKWNVIRDSIYVPFQKDSLVGYNTVKYEQTIKELKSTRFEEIMLFEKSEKVHSYYNDNISRTYIKVDLPLLNNTVFKKECLIAWSYWIGVGQEGQEAYKQNMKSIAGLMGEVSSFYFTTPLASVAMGEVSKLIIPATGEDVSYYFIKNLNNVQQFINGEQFYLFDKGKGRAAYGRNDRIKEGTFYIGLANDNLTRGIEVEVKVLVVKEIKEYENVIYHKERREPEYVTLDKTRLEIKETRFRVSVD